MRDIVKKLRYILDRKQKIHICFLGIMIFIGGLLETLSVSALLPVVGVIMDPVSAMENKYYRTAMEFLKIEDIKGFTIALCLLLMVMYILKNAFLLLLVNEQNRFISYNRNKLISQVLREFLNRPYEFYLDADIPTVFRLTDSDIPNVFHILLSLISMVSEAIVFVCLSVILILQDWKLMLFVIGVFAVITIFMLKCLKPGLSALGAKNLAIQSRIAKWRIQAIYGIKDVKVLHREAFFADNYEKMVKLVRGTAENTL